MRKKILIFVLIVLILVIGSSVWFFIKHNLLNGQNNIIPNQVRVSKEPMEATSSTNISQTATSSIRETQIASSNLKNYRNEKFGFEFQYSGDWKFEANAFYSPFSKFNLIGASKDENYIPDIASPSLLVNVVSTDFASRAFAGMKGKDVVVAGVVGKKYEYEFESMRRIDIDIPFDEYHIILGANMEYESTFNQIVSTFKSLK
jgi:uncharacterized protein YxeA